MERTGRFLLEEILPVVAKKYTLTDKPEDRAICGSSSGGICAFKVARERPDSFQKVVSHIGSFTNIRGGYIYPSLIRKTEAKASEGAYTTPEQKNLLALRRKIRVFLQDGRNDLDNQFGNWPLANQEMAAALKFAGWDYEFVFGEGTHNGNQGSSFFPDTMRWLARHEVNGAGPGAKRPSWGEHQLWRTQLPPDVARRVDALRRDHAFHGFEGAPVTVLTEQFSLKMPRWSSKWLDARSSHVSCPGTGPGAVCLPLTDIRRQPFLDEQPGGERDRFVLVAEPLTGEGRPHGRRDLFWNRHFRCLG